MLNLLCYKHAISPWRRPRRANALFAFGPFRWQNVTAKKLRTHFGQEILKIFQFASLFLVHSFPFTFSLCLLTFTFCCGVIDRQCINFNISTEKENACEVWQIHFLNYVQRITVSSKKFSNPLAARRQKPRGNTFTLSSFEREPQKQRMKRSGAGAEETRIVIKLRLHSRRWELRRTWPNANISCSHWATKKQPFVLFRFRSQSAYPPLDAFQ
jgi:hypothetical protein